MTTMSVPIANGGKTQRRHGLGFWAVAYAFMVVLAYCAVPTPLYAIYAQRDGFSSFTVTVIFAAYAVGVVVSLFTVGHISDWHGRRRLVVPALLISIVSAVIFLTWRAVPGLIVARVISGLGVGAMTATATAWLSELHAAHRPQASVRRAQVVATAANLGGIGLGPLISGALAQWMGAPLTVPYLVSLGALLVALALVLASPETRERPVPMPAYRPQRVSVPPHALGRYAAAAVGAGIAFSAFGLFTSLAPAFLAGTLHRTSHALAGVTAFAVFASAVVAQTAIAGWPTRRAVGAGVAGMLAGMAVVVIAVWMPSPSLALFLLGGVLTGAGAGSLFKGVVSTVAETAVPARRAEALAGMFLAGYIGLSVPVLGLGVLTQYLTPRTSLLIFAAALAVTMLAATPKLMSRREARSSPTDGWRPPTLAS
jgi:MFS family permease